MNETKESTVMDETAAPGRSAPETATVENTPAPIEDEAPAAQEERPEWLEQYIALTNSHYQNLRSLIRYTKTKDESIAKLNGELQKYRDEYCGKVFKPIAMAVISFREDCRKSYADLDKYRYDASRVKRYLGYLGDDFVEMLANVGIEEGSDGWLYNGSPVRQPEAAPPRPMPVLNVPVEEKDKAEENAVSASAVRTAADLLDYLSAVENDIRRILARNEMLDMNLQQLVNYSVIVEQDLVKLLVLPAIRQLISVGEKIGRQAQEYCNDLTDENCNERYADCLHGAITMLDEVLLSGGVTVDTTMNDVFSTKLNRHVKMISTDDPAKDKTIAARYTECYLLNGNVIYPAKVDVYKYTAKND